MSIPTNPKVNPGSNINPYGPSSQTPSQQNENPLNKIPHAEEIQIPSRAEIKKPDVSKLDFSKMTHLKPVGSSKKKFSSRISSILKRFLSFFETSATVTGKPAQNLDRKPLKSSNLSTLVPSKLNPQLLALERTRRKELNNPELESSSPIIDPVPDNLRANAFREAMASRK